MVKHSMLCFLICFTEPLLKIRMSLRNKFVHTLLEGLLCYFIGLWCISIEILTLWSAEILCVLLQDKHETSHLYN